MNKLFFCASTETQKARPIFASKGNFIFCNKQLNSE